MQVVLRVQRIGENAMHRPCVDLSVQRADVTAQHREALPDVGYRCDDGAQTVQPCDREFLLTEGLVRSVDK
jgi:hypothetical protein